MSKRTTLVALALGVGMLTLATVHAQQKSGATLSAMDYIQINQLINRYAFAVDTGANKGADYAALFAPDGKFLQRGGVSHSGPEALANVGYRNSRGPQSVFHYLGSHAIEPTPDGNARGKEQLVQWEFGDDGKPSRVFGGGHYDDIYERTKDGWRFKQRQFIPSQSGYDLKVPTTPVPEMLKISKAPVDAKTMTASDYIEIWQLLSRYPYGLDTGQRHGQMWVDVFTPDATFNKAVGSEALMKIAWQHRPGQGPSYDRNFPQSTIITPTATGAVGRTTTYVLDIGEGGKPSTILNGATYHDEYVRTPAGWRIKKRMVVGKKGGADQGLEWPKLASPVRVAADPGKGEKHNGLAVEDYLDIQRLITAYSMAMDTGAGEGYVYADLFAPDGVFMAGKIKHQGREELKKFAWQHRPGQGNQHVRMFSQNPVIETSPEGATGKVYALVLDFGDDGKTHGILQGGTYHDIYVKTPAGWRIKQRQYVPSKTERPTFENKTASAEPAR